MNAILPHPLLSSNDLEATGLLPDDLRMICQAANRIPEIEAVILFGSRAKSCHKKGSDVDLIITGSELTYDSGIELSDLLNEEYPLPYFFDVVNFNTLENQALIEHVERVGKTLYTHNPTASSSR